MDPGPIYDWERGGRSSSNMRAPRSFNLNKRRKTYTLKVLKDGLKVPGPGTYKR